MNISSTPPTTLAAIKSTTGADRWWFVFLFAVGIFFIGGTIFTILQTARVTATVNSLPTLVYIFSVLYIFTQAIMAYGLLTYAAWLRHTLTFHTITILATTFVILPLLGWQDLVQPSFVAGIHILLLTTIIWSRYSRLRPSEHVLIVTGIYTALLIIMLYLSVMIRL